MYVDRLSNEDKRALLKYATLMAYSESIALWDGKKLDELTSDEQRWSSLELSEDGEVFNGLFRLKAESISDDTTNINSLSLGLKFIKRKFEDELKELPIHNVNVFEKRDLIIQKIQSEFCPVTENQSIEINAPAFPSSVEGGEISTWHKNIGDTVAHDELLVTIETDKVAMEVLAETAGVLTDIVRDEGDSVSGGELLGRIEKALEQNSFPPLYSLFKSKKQNKKIFNTPESAKIAIVELAVLALCDGVISSNKMSFINNFSEQYGIEEFVLEDILLHVKELYAQENRLLSLVLE